MRIKKYVGATLKDVTAQMKADLGPEAIILTSRRVPRGGLFSFVKQDLLEVTAALDESLAATPNAYASPGPETSFQQHLHASQSLLTDQHPVAELQKIADRFQSKKTEDREPSKPPDEVPESAGVFALKTEVENMRATLRSIADHLKYEHMPALPDSLQRAYVQLVQHDVDERLAADLVQSVYARIPQDQKDNAQMMETELLQTIAGVIRRATPQKQKHRKMRVVALVGPTGVGKTTTIAKLASLAKLVEQREVGLITTDTYRIGAVEQLRTFAAIADIPMEVVYQPGEMSEALRKFKDKDVVYIDTVGRSHRARRDLQRVARFLEAADPDEIHLVMNASTSHKAASDIANQFRVVKPTRLLFSKLDEAVTYGPLLNITAQQQLPLSYVTVGQSVPDDIRPADAADFASLVYHGEMAHA